MASSFFGLNIATQGLYTAQTSLNVTGHNIANVETEGYSRQYVIQKATRPLPNNGEGMIGTGSEITSISQYRSVYIDTKYWNTSTDLGQYEVKAEMLNQLEALLNETSDTGISAQMSDLFDNLSTLSTNPAEDAMIANFTDSCDSFADYFNTLASQLEDYQRTANLGVKTCVEQINRIANQVGTLNSQIANLELSGATANDLRDERALLIDELASVVNITAEETTDINGKKNFTVKINGQTLVDGPSVNNLEVRSREALNNVEDESDLYDIYWKTGQELHINLNTASGKLKGYMDVRDGNNGENFTGTATVVTSGTDITELRITGYERTDVPASGIITYGSYDLNYDNAYYDETTGEMVFELGDQSDRYSSVSYDSAGGTMTLVTTDGRTFQTTADSVRIGESVDFKGIPYYTRQLNEFVRTIAWNFNKIHQSGDGNSGQELFGITGYDYTTANGAFDTVGETKRPVGYDTMTIDNFSFNQNILKDYSLLKNTSETGAGESANDIYLSMLTLQHDGDMFEKGEPASYIQSLVSELGIDAKKSATFEKSQSNLVTLISQQRQSVSSVDVNEETTDLIRFQQAYNLSAKMISVMDEVYDVMINQLVRS